MTTPEPRRVRGAERDEQLRKALVPLAPGERPGAVTFAAVAAALMGAANLVAFVAGVEIDGRRPEWTAVAGFCGLMAIAAWGLWRARYWAVLGAQALLTAIVIVFSMFLMRASDLAAVASCVAIIAVAGTLFWKLVGAMARIQAPNRD